MAAVKPRPVRQTVAEQHAEWLGLLRPDGPFLALPVLAEVLPQGLDTVPDQVRDRVRQAWGEVQEAPDLLLSAWNELILTELLRLPARELVAGGTVDSFSGRLRPDLVAYGPGPDGRAMRMFLYQHGWDEPLTKGHGDQASPVEKAAALCRDTGVPLALVSNGRLWALVHARPQEATSVALFDADLWLEEQSLLRAFATLLDARRTLAPSHRPDGTWSDGLTALFARSADEHTQITNTLGRQVRQAVELLVSELARIDRESGGALLRDVPEREIYRGALITLMRLVFMLYAEEQGLMPSDEVYTDAYGVTSLYDRLSAERSLYGDEVGDRRSAAWFRLLALFRAVHSGSEHPDLRIPAYGGSLFNPAKFQWMAQAAVTDRVIHEVLDALLVLRHTRGKAAAERLSYKGLDVEQIGHVYEGLLEFSCLKVSTPYVGLFGKLEPELPLSQVEEELVKGEQSFQAWLKKECDATANQLKKATAFVPTTEDLADLHAACDNDAAFAERVRPFFGLLRRDLRGLPTVFPAGSVLFTQVGDRRATGTHYTPKSLAEEIVKHTLDPLCHRPGPAQGAEEKDWQVKPAAELLDLNICDPAMGSGAFLVSACRYIAERLLEAWQRDGTPDEIADLLGASYDREDLMLIAKRRAAACCVYGVDRDDMAVELAKLSLWIETLAKDKPFSFLDHALRHGDSLVGLIDENQVTSFHLDPERGRTINARFESVIEDLLPMLTRAQELREEIEAFPAEDITRIAEKEQKLREAEALTEQLRLAADAVAAAALSTAGQPQEKFDDRLVSISDAIQATLIARKIKQLAHGAEDSPVEQSVRDQLAIWLKGGRKEPVNPLHWPLEFPEVMRRGGFAAIVGNPPFVGGQRLTGSMGVDMREYLVHHIGGGQRGSADLCSYFYLRDLAVTGDGRVGIIATNTISQGDTRDVGLANAVGAGWRIYRAEKSQPWPGTASLEVSLVWTARSDRMERRFLDGRQVTAITASLDAESRVKGVPQRLTGNAGQSFIGSYILGKGFLLDPEQAKSIIEKDSKYRKVLSPYVNGEDLNSRWDSSASRWVIDFHDWSEDRAREYGECFEIVEREVKPFRALNNDKRRRELWWRFTRPTPDLYSAIAGYRRALAIALTSRTALPVWQPIDQVFSHAVGVFATDRSADFALLSSAFHHGWAVVWSSSLKGDLRYAPSDVYETFPKPLALSTLDRAGEILHAFRQNAMEQRQIGLTSLYNFVHDSKSLEVDIEQLRQIHIDVDEATRTAYALDEERESGIREFEAKVASAPLPSWRDIELGHGFHETRQGVRFTISPQAREDVMDKLLALNHYRYDQELKQGLHNKKGARKKASGAARPELGAASGVTMPARADSDLGDGLFAPPDALF